MMCIGERSKAEKGFFVGIVGFGVWKEQSLGKFANSSTLKHYSTQPIQELSQRLDRRDVVAIILSWDEAYLDSLDQGIEPPHLTQHYECGFRLLVGDVIGIVDLSGSRGSISDPPPT